MTGPGQPGSEAGSAQEVPRRRRHTRWLAARVVAVQVVTLIALWCLQSTWGGG